MRSIRCCVWGALRMRGGVWCVLRIRCCVRLRLMCGVVGWLCPDSRSAFQRQVHQTPRTHRMQGTIFADAGRLSLLGFVFKPVSWLVGDSRLRQTFSLRIHLVERQSLSRICPSTIILLATGPLKPPLTPALAGLSPVL